MDMLALSRLRGHGIWGWRFTVDSGCDVWVVGSNSHGARPGHLIITMWASRLSINKSLSGQVKEKHEDMLARMGCAGAESRGAGAGGMPRPMFCKATVFVK